MRAPLNGPITPTTRRRTSALVALLAVTALLLAGCGSDDGDDESTSGDPTSTETTEATTDSTDASTSETTDTTEAPSSDTTEAPDGTGATTEPTGPALLPGDVCSLEEGDPDCIDPDGDGEGVYLEGGADCAATAPDISICEDLDGDGVAGYPDEYEDLPTCSADVPPPCNNPPGSSDDE